MAKKRMAKKSKGSESSCGTATQNEVRHVAANSLEFSRDAKGQARWSIKIYGERDEMSAVADEVLSLDARLREETAPRD